MYMKKNVYTHTYIYIIHTHLQCFKESIWKRTGFPRACRPWRRVPSANQFGPCPVGQRSRTWSCGGMRTDRGVVWSAGKSWENQRPILENECFFGWKIIELIGRLSSKPRFSEQLMISRNLWGIGFKLEFMGKGIEETNMEIQVSNFGTWAIESTITIVWGYSGM